MRYGVHTMRIAGPIAMGALHFDPKRFALFNAFGAAVWALVIGGAGYVLGHSLEALLGDLAQYETALLWGALAVIAVGAIVHRVGHLLRLRRARAGACGKAPPGV